jgi:translation initiation factor IF-2
MAVTTVAQFAAQLNRPTSTLLEQLHSAGVAKASPDDALTDGDKERLLEYLRTSHGTASTERKKIVLTRKSTSEIKQADASGKARTIQVEVRKKRTFVKRDEAPAAEEAAPPVPVIDAEEQARRDAEAASQAALLQRQMEDAAERQRQAEAQAQREREAAEAAAREAAERQAAEAAEAAARAAAEAQARAAAATPEAAPAAPVAAPAPAPAPTTAAAPAATPSAASAGRSRRVAASTPWGWSGATAGLGRRMTCSSGTTACRSTSASCWGRMAASSTMRTIRPRPRRSASRWGCTN